MPKFQIEISREKNKEIQDLMTKTGISTKREYFNTALTVLNWIIHEKERFRIIASVDEENKSYKELVIASIQNF